MTTLNNPVTRRCVKPLDHSFGCDSGAALVVTLIPGTDTIPDTIELRPHRTRRPERMALIDVYRLAVRARSNRDVLEKARAKKERKAIRLAAQRAKRAEKRLFSKPFRCSISTTKPKTKCK